MIRDNSEELNFFDGLINNANLFNRPLTILDETDIEDFFKNLNDVKNLKGNMYGKMRKRYINYLVTNLANCGGYEEAVTCACLLYLLDRQIFKQKLVIRPEGKYFEIYNEYIRFEVDCNDFNSIKRNISNYVTYIKALKREFIELKLQDNILPCNSMTLIAITIQAAIDIRD